MILEDLLESLMLTLIIIESQPLKSDDHVNIAANGHTLQIKKAQISDTGRYTCVASNIAGEDELDFDVNIQGNTNVLIVHHLIYMICLSNEKEIWLGFILNSFFSVDNNMNSLLIPLLLLIVTLNMIFNNYTCFST